jgi:hypothetical protein
MLLMQMSYRSGRRSGVWCARLADVMRRMHHFSLAVL